MTHQVLILIGSRAGIKENGELIVNPFYSATEEDIKNNLDYAKEIYSWVFAFFVSGWCMKKCEERGLPCNTPEEIEKNGERSLQMIRNGEIPPIPNYVELKELKI